MRRATGLEDGALHIHVGMAIWVAGVAIAGDVGALWPLAVAAVAELANEALDRWREGSWRIADTTMDVVNSLLWPLVLFCLARSGVI
jgi:hypothetical protein